jgi:3'-phosphoadenosine 5'-phosphosulfate sulfotransferase (PAPS reductase)/FAD synthetase
MIIAWWSAGVTSAVATKLAIDEYGIDNVLPVYFHIDTAHEDNARFKAECEEWYGREIVTHKAEKYNNQFDVIRKDKYINGAGGARCTLVLKKRVRMKLEKELDYTGQVFGFEYSKKEINRAIRFSEQYPNALPLFPLIEHKMTKPECLYYLEKQGIERPEMYKLGYGNNNCIGCVKGGMGYWNKIRKDFPDVYAEMAKAERELGRSCLKTTFLDELDPQAGREQKIIMPDCGNFCDIEFADVMHKNVEKVYEEPKQLRLI